ncbi:MAG: hypothetical protein ACFCUS_11680 [Rubrimonas sp.]|uniref:hypothetical protein n=1 Tax=Rubrimonas sp. TaxID=2036015 RepID=UPI002FDE571B
MKALALALALAAAPALAEPAFTFSAPGWEMGVGPAEVYAFQSFAPRPGAVALSITLHAGPARQLESLTASSLGEMLTLRDGDGATLLETVLAEPIRRGAFAVTFADPGAARRAAARMLGR